jgi:excisionase family DNA binding protein
MSRSMKSVRSNSVECVTFSVQQTADYWGVSPSLVRLEIARGNLRPVRIGGRVLLLKAEIDRRLGVTR